MIFVANSRFIVLGSGATRNSMRNFCVLIPREVPVSLGLENGDMPGDTIGDNIPGDMPGDSMGDRLGADSGDTNGEA